MARFDILLEVPREEVTTVLQQQEITTSSLISDVVNECRVRQQLRYKDSSFSTNAQLTAKGIQQFISLSSEVEEILIQAAKQFYLSTRVVHRTIKLARTIADLSHDDNIKVDHITEAIQYRARSMFVV